MTTLREAVEGIPEASWTDTGGALWTSRDILSQWPDDKLNQQVDYGEDRMGRTEIRAAGQGGRVLLIMEPPTGWAIPPEPVAEPEESEQ